MWDPREEEEEERTEEGSHKSQLTCPVFSLLMSRRGVERGALGDGELSGKGLSWPPPPLAPAAPPNPNPTYLLMREAKGCTCREVPMMMRRSTFRKSWGGGVVSEGPRGSAGARLPLPTPLPCSSLPLPYLGGALTDCMQEKNLAGRFSPKNTMSRQTDGQTQRQKEKVNREAETGSERERE